MNRILTISALALSLLAMAAWMPADYERLIYNATDSAPRGWYWLEPATEFFSGDDVLIDLPEPTAQLAAERHYLPAGVPLLKRVGARGGQHVCIRDGTVVIDGKRIATVLSHDTAGRPLSAWTHCRLLQRSELFLLNPAKTASFDSRYFGPVAVSRARGRAIPLWTWESP
jgi:conjugative transfer signal peptidase TraF